MLVSRLRRGDGVEGDRLDRFLDRLSVERAERHRVLRHDRHLAVIEEAHPARVLEERRDIRRDEVLALAVADDDAAGVRDPCGDDLPRVADRDERERGRALEARQDRERGVLETPAGLQLLLEEVDGDLGVGLARKAMAARDERRLQRFEVLDDAVVDDRGDAAAIDVRVRVLLARPAMGRPARVTDPGVPGGTLRGDDGGEVVELAFGAQDLQRAVALHGDARGVVAAILEATEPVHEERKRFARPDVAYDPAHQPRCSFAAATSADAVLDAIVSLRASTVIRRTGSVPEGRTTSRPVDPRFARARS